MSWDLPRTARRRQYHVSVALPGVHPHKPPFLFAIDRTTSSDSDIEDTHMPRAVSGMHKDLSRVHSPAACKGHTLRYRVEVEELGVQ